MKKEITIPISDSDGVRYLCWSKEHVGTNDQCTLWFMNLTITLADGSMSVVHEKLGELCKECYAGTKREDMLNFCEELVEEAVGIIYQQHKKEWAPEEGEAVVCFSSLEREQLFRKIGGANMVYRKKSGTWAEMVSVEHITAGTHVVTFLGGDQVVARGIIK